MYHANAATTITISADSTNASTHAIAWLVSCTDALIV